MNLTLNELNRLNSKIDAIYQKENKTYNNKTFSNVELNYMKSFYKSVPEYLWNVKNKRKICECGKETEFINIIKGYKDLCPFCLKQQKIESMLNTKKEKYGYSTPFEDKKIQEIALLNSKTELSKTKRMNTKIKNDTLHNSIFVIQKSKQTKKEKYNDENFVNLEKIKETKLIRFNDENYNNRKKAKDTMTLKYGVDSFAKSDIFKEKFSNIFNPTYNHFLNIENFNDDYIQKNFIKNDNFDLESACIYFNCTFNAFKKKSYYSTKHAIGRTVLDGFKVLYNDFFYYNDRKTIKPFELDMVSLDNKLAIEYNGLYWHCHVYKEKNYHLVKTNLCEKNELQLFHIFENEWVEPLKKEIWKSKINLKLKDTNVTKFFARKCVIKELKSNEIKGFLNENHLQGYISSSYNLGLFFNEKLVSVMTFSKSRMNKSYDWEMIRFCSLNNTIVIGAGGKLLSFFEKEKKPNSLISYANRRWSNGNFYKKLNFTFSHLTKPNYFYFKKGSYVLHSRNQFQKHMLSKKLPFFNNTISEEQNMFLNQYYKIYDCGNMVFVKNY